MKTPARFLPPSRALVRLSRLHELSLMGSYQGKVYLNISEYRLWKLLLAGGMTSGLAV